jgi:hypothetical protein
VAAVSQSTPSPEPRSMFLRASPALFALVLVLALAISLGVKLRTRGVFACPASYGAAFLSNCNSPNFGDYDHGALWFGLEPDTLRAAAAAKVMLLGNSRLQFAFSGANTREWFGNARLPYYLLGFSHSETVMFMGPLLARLEPRARVVVINVDRFFDDRVSPPAEQILREKDSASRYREKQVWQAMHQPVCGALPVICGDTLAVYRERGNGAWRTAGVLPDQAAPVSDGKPSNVDHWPVYIDLAKKFVGNLGVAPECVVLTLVPTVDTKREEAKAIAAALGRPLVTPNVEGLTTFDGSHLDPASAQRWAAAFLEQAGPRIRECTADRAAAAPTVRQPS